MDLQVRHHQCASPAELPGVREGEEVNGLVVGKYWTWGVIREMQFNYHFYGPIALSTAWGYHGA